MKFFAFILSILVVGFSFLPCYDVAEGSGDAKTELAMAKDQPTGDTHEDVCSPFCHCGCCATYSINYSPSFTTLLPPAASVCFNSYITGDLANVSLPIWQPPQLKA